MDNEEKELKAAQAGRDVAETAAKAAGTYFGGAVGGKAVDAVAKTKTGGKILDATGKAIGKVPIVNNVLANNQENIAKAKPIADAAIDKGLNKDNSLKDKDSSGNKKEGLNDNKGLLNNKNEDSSKQGESSDDSDKIFKKKKNTKLYLFIASFFISIICMGLFFGMFFQPIIALGEKIGAIMDKLGDYADAFTNIVSFKGVGTSEETFWAELNSQYNQFSSQANTAEPLDISLLAATLHYEKVIDPAFYNETSSVDEGDPKAYGNGPLDSLHDKVQTKLFYDWAYDQLGNFNTMDISERGLSGALVSTYVSATCEPDTFANNWSNFWKDTGNFFSTLKGITIATLQDRLQAWNLFYLYETTIANLNAVNFNVVDFVKQQFTQKFVTVENDAYSFAEIFKVPKVTCSETKIMEYGEEKTVPTNVHYELKLFNDYAKYEKYLTKYYLPTYYINCSNCAYRNESDEKKEQILNIMLDEIYELRNQYAEIIEEKMGNIYVGQYQYLNTVILSGISSCPVQPGTYISRGWQIGTASCYVNGTYVGKGCDHKGIDFASGSGSPIYAVADGTVVYAAFNSSGYGNRIVIDHGNGMSSTYNHLLNGSFFVTVGSSVVEGQQIALMGSTGNSTGSHLHFEILQNGERINPATVISCG